MKSFHISTEIGVTSCFSIHALILIGFLILVSRFLSRLPEETELYLPRRPRFVMVVSSWLMSIVLIQRTLSVLSDFELIDLPFWQYLARQCCLYPSFGLFSLYLYHIHYDLACGHYLLQHEWAVYVQPDFEQNCSYLRHRARFGNIYWTAKFLTCFCGFFLIANIAFYQLGIRAAEGGVTTIYFVLIIVLIVWSACKVKTISDRIFLYDQFVACIWTVCISCVVGGGMAALSLFVGNLRLLSLIYAGFAGGVVFVLAFLMMEFPAWKNAPRLRRLSLENLPSTSTTTPPKSLKEILSRSDTLQLFMEFLIRELSHENLMFLVEVAQLHKIVLKTHDCDSLRKFPFELPTDLPQSAVVNELPFDCVGASKRLYEKYIATDAPWVLNLSWECREEATKFFVNLDSGVEKVDECKVLMGFETAVKEIFNLIKGNKSRFISR